MDTFKLNVVASNKVFFDGECESITIPYCDGGGQCFLAHHANTVMPIDVGELTIKTANGEKISALIGSGFLEFLNNTCKIVCVSAELPEEIDEKRAQEAKERAEEELRQKLSQMEYNATKANLARAMERIKVKNRHEI